MFFFIHSLAAFVGRFQCKPARYAAAGNSEQEPRGRGRAALADAGGANWFGHPRRCQTAVKLPRAPIDSHVRLIDCRFSPFKKSGHRREGLPIHDLHAVARRRLHDLLAWVCLVARNNQQAGRRRNPKYPVVESLRHWDFIFTAQCAQKPRQSRCGCWVSARMLLAAQNTASLITKSAASIPSAHVCGRGHVLRGRALLLMWLPIFFAAVG